MGHQVIDCRGRADISDEQLLAAVGGRDECAFDELYARAAPAVARFAWSVSGSREAVDELLQETFLLVWRRPDRVRLVNDSALPWLLVTCRNLARNHARRQRRTVQLLEQPDGATDDAAALELRWVLDSMANLPDTDRRVCELVLLQGLSYKEAAERLLISEASVGKRLHRSRQRIRKDVQ